MKWLRVANVFASMTLTAGCNKTTPPAAQSDTGCRRHVSRPMKRPILSMILGGLVFAACSEKKAPAPAPPPKADIEPMLDASVPAFPGWPLPAGTTVTPAMLCHAFLSPVSELKDTCARKYDPQDSARDYLATSLKECAPRIERSLANGRAELDQGEALKCIGARIEFRRTGRGEIPGTPWEHACDGVLVGKTAPGGVCREDWECTSGYGCAVGRNSKVGKCTTPTALGGPCVAPDLHLLPPRVCEAGTYCSADTCRKRDQEGEGCGPYSCVEGTFCSTGLHKCVKSLAPAGAACLRHDDCAVGHYCDVRKCVPQKPAAAKCLDSIECSGDCTHGTCTGRCG